MELFYILAGIVVIGVSALVGLTNGFSFKKTKERNYIEEGISLLRRMTKAEEKESR